MENYHTHTEFCDGRASMAEMAAEAYDAGFNVGRFAPQPNLLRVRRKYEG